MLLFFAVASALSRGAVLVVDEGVNRYDYLRLAGIAARALEEAPITVYLTGSLGVSECSKEIRNASCVVLEFPKFEAIEKWKEMEMGPTLRFLSRSHAAKILALILSPYEVTLFLDADAHPCRSFDAIFQLLSSSSEGSLLDIYDFLAAQNVSPGFTRLGIPETYPIAFTEVNAGVIFARKSPALERFLFDWLDRFVETLRGQEDDYKAHVQQPLRAALYDAVRNGGLRLYVLPAIWNMRAWHRYLIEPRLLKPHTKPDSRCCFNASAIDIIIDHKCGSRYRVD
ncbi:hypothetical protein CTAYLR_000572 [Chrysophaeum taylorii]|uniref:Nucleotide-diphospho-sugar transferase domain-containing protein n=1 Tax=Chrysophaeum taylorii TaxID=2483200 RepID=A0AAD7UJF1_9STRA|nr:hypothetical protein CTAYLR_000572 [Chrysophaeum taylorii]